MIILACVTGLGAFSACSRKADQPKPAAQSPPQTSPVQTKDIWLSETTGKEYHVSVEGDTFRAEWVNIPPELSAHGAFIKTECKKKDSKWVGTSASYLPCTVSSGAGSKLDNWCHLETNIEILSVTPDRISGNGESIRKFDCMKCKILEKGNKDFFWTPKK